MGAKISGLFTKLKLIASHDNVVLFTDGGSRGNPGIAACAAIVMVGDEVQTFDGRYLGDGCTNNFAEYQGLIMGLRFIKSMKFAHLTIKMDSELIVKQINGLYKIKDPNLQALALEVKKLLHSLSSDYTLVHVRREENFLADRLVNVILDNIRRP